MRFVCGSCFLLVFIVVDTAQTVFRAGTTLVGVNVQVTDRRSGLPIGALRETDFQLEEDGVPRQIVDCLADNAPLDIVLVIQLNPGMQRATKVKVVRVEDRLRQVLSELDWRDQVAVMSHTSQPKVFLKLSADAFANEIALRDALTDRRYSRGWRLYDAILAATGLFPKKSVRERRRAIVLVYDRGEIGSKITPQKLLPAVLEKNAIVYAAQVTTPEWQPRIVIGIGIGRGPLNKEWRKEWVITLRRPGTKTQVQSIDQVVEETGGEVLKGNDAVRLLSNSFERIRKRYLLHFYAAPASGGVEERKVVVRLSPEAEKKYPDAIIRGQKTYAVEALSPN